MALQMTARVTATREENYWEVGIDKQLNVSFDFDYPKDEKLAVRGDMTLKIPKATRAEIAVEAQGWPIGRVITVTVE